MPNRGEFNLEFSFWGMRMLIEYLEDKVDPVPGLDLGLPFSENLIDMIDLSRFQDIPDDDSFGSELLSSGDHFI